MTVPPPPVVPSRPVRRDWDEAVDEAATADDRYWNDIYDRDENS